MEAVITVAITIIRRVTTVGTARHSTAATREPQIGDIRTDDGFNCKVVRL